MTYARYPLIYGLFAGAAVALIICAAMIFKDQLGFSHSMWFGYLAMLVALTFLYVGVKRYRDVEKGGVIKFFPALGMGVAIAVNGQARFRKLLGGEKGSPVAENFDLVEPVEPGTTIDFIVDPGPAANADHDATTVDVSISTAPR